MKKVEKVKPELFLKNVHPNSMELGQNYSFHDKPIGPKNYVGTPKRAMFDGYFSKRNYYDKDGNYLGNDAPPSTGPHTHATLTDENGYRGWMSHLKLDEPGKITEYQFKDLPDDVNKQINQYAGGKANRKQTKKRKRGKKGKNNRRRRTRRL
jgi:hypothetical protein